MVFGVSERIKSLESISANLSGRDVLKKVFLSLLGLFMLMYGLSYGYMWYANSMAEPVNEDVYYPEAAFQPLYESYEEELPKERLKNLEGTRIEKRSKISNIALLDSAVIGGKVVDVLQGEDESTDLKYQGYATVNRCGSVGAEQDDYECRNTSAPAAFSTMYKGWMLLAKYSGDLDTLYENQTVRKRFLDYVDRATFYDSYLLPDYEMKPVEIVMYSSNSGLHIIGEDNSPVSVNGEKVNVTGSGDWSRANISLKPGYHTIRRDNFSIEMPVHGYKPNFGVASGEEFQIEGAENRSLYFRKAIIEGDNWSREVSLGENALELDLSGEPNQIRFVRGNFTVTEKVGSNSEDDIRPLNGEALGMKKEEYQRFRWMSKRVGYILSLLPGVSNPQEQSHAPLTQQRIS